MRQRQTRKRQKRNGGSISEFANHAGRGVIRGSSISGAHTARANLLDLAARCGQSEVPFAT